MIRLVRRAEPSRAMVYLAPVVALVATFLAGTLLFALLGVPVLDALYAFFVEPLTTRYGLAELGVKAAPLILIGAALAIGFRANVWNIGAEGQLIAGAICGGAVALWFYEVERWFVLPLMMVAGIFGGMVWAAIPALLKTRFNASEILTSLMLTYIASLLLNFLVHGPMRDPDGFNFPESRLFHMAATLPVVLEGTRLHIGFPIALLVVVALWVLLSRTVLGFELKVMGQAPRAAGFAGFRESTVIWFCLLSGGAAAGLAGLLEVAGPIGQLLPTVSPGYGFTAIIVAFLGRLHPVGVLFAGLLMALSYLGGESAQIALNLPTAVTGVFQGMLLFFLLAADVLILYRLQLSTSVVTSVQDGPS
ncbi:MAG: ABC transporter permease [Gammaproteobacteria bacterium]|nr:ABC transporter permease [Gammaproteobacteria bacterium]